MQIFFRGCWLDNILISPYIFFVCSCVISGKVYYNPLVDMSKSSLNEKESYLVALDLTCIHFSPL